MGINNLISGGKDAIKKAVERFPMAILLSAAAALLEIYVVEMSLYSWEDGVTRIVGVLALGVPLFLCIHVFLEKINKDKDKVSFIYYAVGVVLLVLYWGFVYTDVSMVIITRHIGLILISVLGFLFIPYIKSEHNYEMYIIKILGRLLLTGVYSVVLGVGISAILATINYLLEVSIKYELYSYTWLLIIGIFAPSYFLGEIPRKDEGVSDKEYPKGLKVLMLYIIMPLISIYTVILYIYFGKIVITTNWPKGLVSHLVLWYGVISAGTLFLISNLRSTNKWAKFYSKVFPMTILPLMVMMFISIGIRISDYGVTENRYYVVALGLWVFGTMVYLTLAKVSRFIILPISLATIMIISIGGPISSYNTSMRSQNKRFEHILKGKDMVADGKIVKPSKELSEMNKQDISSILHYFERNHSLSQVKYLPENFTFNEMERVFGFEEVEGYIFEANRYFYYGTELTFTGVDIAGYDYMFQGATYSSNGGNRFEKGISADYMRQEGKIVLYEDGEEIYSKEISEYAQRLVEKYGWDNQGKTIDANMVFEDETDKIKVKFIFRSMSGETAGSSYEIINVDCEFVVLVKMK